MPSICASCASSRPTRACPTSNSRSGCTCRRRPAWRACARSRRSGFIRQYVALLDARQLGLHLNVFISISLKQQTRTALEAFEAKVAARDEVMECYLTTGDADYLLRVALPDIESLERFILEQLSPMKEIEKIRSSFTLKQVRYKTALPLAAPAAAPRTGSRRAASLRRRR